MGNSNFISRRAMLRGMGTALALPWFESLASATRSIVCGGNQPPVRMAFLFAPNGKHMPDWTPKTEGVLDKLPPTLQPLEKLKSEIFIPSGLSLTTAGGKGCGGHSCTVGQFLTGTLPKRTLGNQLRNGVSVDQIAAAKIGHLTRFPSLELGCVPSKYSGDCDSGYSCVYTTHISWRTQTAPLPKEINPRAVFDRMFGNRIKHDEKRSRAIRDLEKKSILDFVRTDALELQRRLGQGDRQKLDEYLYSVREIEKRMEGSEKLGKMEVGVAYPRPAGLPMDPDEQLRLMMDMIVLAFQTDSTRVISFMIGNGSDNRSYPQVGVSEGHHTLSHHQGDKKKQAKISTVNRHHAAHLAYLLEKMKSIKEGDGTLLDQSMILYGCAIGDGNSHDHLNLPILLAGRAGGKLKPGRHVKYKNSTPLTNLYLSMLERIGVPTKKMGDSTGSLEFVVD